MLTCRQSFETQPVRRSKSLWGRNRKISASTSPSASRSTILRLDCAAIAAATDPPPLIAGRMRCTIAASGAVSSAGKE